MKLREVLRFVDSKQIGEFRSLLRDFAKDPNGAFGCVYGWLNSHIIEISLKRFGSCYTTGLSEWMVIESYSLLCCLLTGESRAVHSFSNPYSGKEAQVVRSVGTLALDTTVVKHGGFVVDVTRLGGSAGPVVALRVHKPDPDDPTADLSCLRLKSAVVAEKPVFLDTAPLLQLRPNDQTNVDDARGWAESYAKKAQRVGKYAFVATSTVELRHRERGMGSELYRVGTQVAKLYGFAGLASLKDTRSPEADRLWRRYNPTS